MSEIRSRKRYTFLSFAAIIAVTAAVSIPQISCADKKNKRLKISKYGECVHCHGESLEGIKDPRTYCRECHDTSVIISAAQIESASMKKTLGKKPHIHTTKNIFNPSPSCFSCHRKQKFDRGRD